MMRWYLGALPIFAFSTAAVTAPPAPPPPGISDIAAEITGTFKPEMFDQYASLFAKDVKIYKNGELLASDKAEWLVMARKMAAAWHIRTIDSAPSYKGILIAESISDIPPYKPGVIVDCCFWGRTALYTFDESEKINKVQFLESGGYWGTPDRPH